MSLRIPLSAVSGPPSRLDALDYDIAQQKADALGRIGRQVEQALGRLRALPAAPDMPSDEHERRSALIDEAADRVWALMVQREMCGLRHWEAAIKDYAIPREVLNRMGRIAR